MRRKHTQRVQSELSESPCLRFLDDDSLRCSFDDGAAGVLCFELGLSSRLRCFSLAELSGDVTEDSENMRSPSLTARLTPEFLSCAAFENPSHPLSTLPNCVLSSR